MVAFAIDAAGAGSFFERANRQQPLDEDFEKFDKAAVFLHGDDQAFIFIAEMFFHKLSGLPVAQLAFGRGGTPLGFRGFGGDFLELTA